MTTDQMIDVDQVVAVCRADGPSFVRCQLAAGHGARCSHEARLANGALLRWDYIAPATVVIDGHSTPTLFDAVMGWSPSLASVPMLLTCPSCGERHIDAGEFAVKPHHTHACQKCGMVWRPAIGPTVGVRFLPGFKDETMQKEPKA